MAEILSDQSEVVKKLKAKQMVEHTSGSRERLSCTAKHNHINLKNCKQCSYISTLQDVIVKWTLPIILRFLQHNS
jgi:hypothetical protein